MNKELVMAGVLLSVSTALKICSVIVLCQIPAIVLDDVEHNHQHLVITNIKREQQRTVLLEI